MTSYGTQKLIGELLLNDYTRRGIFDGIGIRLPTIVVRPGKPNKAASGFFSGIIREPLAGVEAVLPVEDDVRHWVASPAAATGFLLHAATMDLAPLGGKALPDHARPVDQRGRDDRGAARGRGRGCRRADPARTRRHHPRHRRGLAARLCPDRALAAGFTADASFQDIIRAHIRDTAAGG